MNFNELFGAASGAARESMARNETTEKRIALLLKIKKQLEVGDTAKALESIEQELVLLGYDKEKTEENK